MVCNRRRRRRRRRWQRKREDGATVWGREGGEREYSYWIYDGGAVDVRPAICNPWLLGRSQDEKEGVINNTISNTTRYLCTREKGTLCGKQRAPNRKGHEGVGGGGGTTPCATQMHEFQSSPFFILKMLFASLCALCFSCRSCAVQGRKEEEEDGGGGAMHVLVSLPRPVLLQPKQRGRTRREEGSPLSPPFSPAPVPGPFVPPPPPPFLHEAAVRGQRPGLASHLPLPLCSAFKTYTPKKGDEEEGKEGRKASRARCDEKSTGSRGLRPSRP